VSYIYDIITAGASLSVKKRRIEKYETSSGLVPFDEWFEDLDSSTQARVDARLDRVALGNFGDYKSIGEGVFELRLTFGPGYRIYYALDGLEVVLLLVGGDKKTQAKDIKTAQGYWKAYRIEKET
jgi:putative addiction module killer protein